ncbi:MAG: protein XagA, partial [Candidatus Binatota bacterium]|nr:protein XagA [Candidatus Binatota bacterium]
MKNCFGLGRVLAIGLIALPDAAFAGAWTLNAGQGLGIVTASVSQSDKAFDEKSSPQSIPRYSKGELQALLQYGATDWLTLIFAPSLQHVAIGGPFDAQRTGLGYTDVGGRMRLSEGNSWVVSAQTTFRIPGANDKS